MDARLQRFADLLRQNGVRVSTAEVLDAARALEAVGLEDPHRVRAALRTTLVKRAGDGPLFERLFDLAFLGLRAVSEEAGPGLAGALRAAGLTEAEQAAILAVLERLEARLSELGRALLEGEGDAVARRLQAAADRVDLRRMTGFMQQGRFTAEVLERAGLSELEADVASLGAALSEAGLPPEVEARIREVLRERVGRLRAAARRLVGDAFRQAHLARLDPELGRLLEERPLQSLSRREIEQLREAVDRLVRRLRDRLERRRRVVRRGRLDLQRTLRRSLATGGLPAAPVFRRRRKEVPELVLLVDVSDSVRNVARLFLQITHALQAQVRRVRSFLFVADLAEATELFRRVDVHRAVDLAFAGRVVSLHARSNYGRALRTFEQAHLGAVNRRTTVFVLGDGRNNYHAPHAEVLGAIRRRARRLVWLCPEDRFSWGFGDSAMPSYAAECDRVEVVRKVSDLGRVLEQTLG